MFNLSKCVMLKVTNLSTEICMSLKPQSYSLSLFDKTHANYKYEIY